MQCKLVVWIWLHILFVVFFLLLLLISSDTVLIQPSDNKGEPHYLSFCVVCHCLSFHFHFSCMVGPCRQWPHFPLTGYVMSLNAAIEKRESENVCVYVREGEKDSIMVMHPCMVAHWQN